MVSLIIEVERMRKEDRERKEESNTRSERVKEGVREMYREIERGIYSLCGVVHRVREKLCGRIAQNHLGAKKCLHILTFG